MGFWLFPTPEVTGNSIFICYWNVKRKANKQNPSELQAWLRDSSSHTLRGHEEAFTRFRDFINWQTTCMVFLQFSGKYAHVPVPGPVTPQSICKWSTTITEMQTREWGFATKCWTENYAVIPSKCWKAMGNVISIKNKTKEKMYNVWLESQNVVEFWRSTTLLRQSLPESGAQGLVQMVSKSSDWGTTASPALPYGPSLHCLECSSFYSHLFNMDFHYTTLNVHTSLFLRNTRQVLHWNSPTYKGCLPSPGWYSSVFVLGNNFLFPHLSDTTMIVTAYKNKQIHTTFLQFREKWERNYTSCFIEISKRCTTVINNKYFNIQ